MGNFNLLSDLSAKIYRLIAFFRNGSYGTRELNVNNDILDESNSKIRICIVIVHD